MSNILVTGTSSGFGFLTTKTLLAAGHTVFAGMRDPHARSAEPVAALRDAAASSSGTLHVCELDVTSDDSVNTAVASAIETVGTLDVLVNNAGLAAYGHIEGYTADQFQRVFDVNVYGVQRMTQAALAHMRPRKSGLVINIGSGLGRYVLPFMAPYAITKYAIECLHDTYALELAPFGVEFALIQPGAFPTNLVANALTPKLTERLAEYGELADMPQKMFAGLGEMFSGPHAPNPQLVADKVAELVGMPSGARPLRSVVDTLTGQAAEAINEVCANVQKQVLAGFGMG